MWRRELLRHPTLSRVRYAYCERLQTTAHHQSDDLGAGFEVLERGAVGHPVTLAGALPCLKQSSSDKTMGKDRTTSRGIKHLVNAQAQHVPLRLSAQPQRQNTSPDTARDEQRDFVVLM
jgi:hypothetical protein